MSFWICETCAVEHSEQVEVCAICADERQWVPADGQHWTTLEELSAAGYKVDVKEVEPGLHGVTSTPSAGIGQQSMLVRTAEGNLLWDPIGYLDDDAVEQVRALGARGCDHREPPAHVRRTGRVEPPARRRTGLCVARPTRSGWRGRTRRSGPGPARSTCCPASR